MNIRNILENYSANARACMNARCGFCREECPVYKQGKLDSYTAKGKLTILYWLLNSHVYPRKHSLSFSDDLVENLYACSTCGFCEVPCGFPITEAIEALRYAAILSGKGPMPAHKKIEADIKNDGNPYGETRATRNAWIPKETKISKNANTLFFVGCTPAYRAQNVAQCFVRILNRCDTPFTILEDEECCGSVLLRGGQRELAEQLAVRNAKRFEGNGFNTIITTCPHGYRTFKKDYPALLGRELKPNIKHSVHVIKELIDKETLRFSKRVNLRVTYHDPCYLGRHMGVYEEPRFIIENIPGIELIEMDWNKKVARCCGAGGTLRWAFPDMSLAIAKERIKEAMELNVDAIVTSCAFCTLNFSEAVKEMGIPMKVYNIEELVYAALS